MDFFEQDIVSLADNVWVSCTDLRVGERAKIDFTKVFDDIIELLAQMVQILIPAV